MIAKVFKNTREYFSLRNYKYETIFHIAARHNALDSLKTLLQKVVFVPHMLKKDYEGNTAIHIAAKRGNLEVLEFLLSSVTAGFLMIQNDFGFTPAEAAVEKARLMEDELASKGPDEAADYRQKKLRVREAARMI